MKSMSTLFARVFATTFTAAVLLVTPARAESEDARQSITLAPAERAFVLSEMRGFLVSVEGIVSALASDRVAEAHDAAKKSGMGVMHGVPPSLRQKLPMEFMKMGHATHQAFDALAEEARTLGDKGAILKKLDGILNTCNTCHASYRLSTE